MDRIVLAGIDFYQERLAPAARRAGITCRFVPSCSHYAEVVIARYASHHAAGNVNNDPVTLPAFAAVARALMG